MATPAARSGSRTNEDVQTKIAVSHYAGKIFINLTPHVIRVKIPQGDVYDFPVSGIVARVDTRSRSTFLQNIGDIPVWSGIVGASSVHDLPDPAPDTYYIVSSRLARAVPDRRDLLFPAARPNDCPEHRGDDIYAVAGLLRV